ncbi:SDR family oxidoreductase [Candidatus Pelagibacter sp.]|nr:SDR family oxidoreductase [Candidatus Pelagibacter sp.]
MNYFNLKGMNVLITGAAGHLGKAISVGLAEYGAKVFLNGRDEKKLFKLKKKINAVNLSAEIAHFDIENFNEVKKFFLKTKKLDILINNAYHGKTGTLENFNLNNYKESLNINVIALSNLVDQSLPLLKKSKNPSIINISSMYGSIIPDPYLYKNTGLNNPPHYGVAKAALEHYSKYASVNLAKYGIRVNTISPGPFPNKSIIKKFPKFITRLKKKNPLNRIGKPKDIITSILFLASPNSSFVTGSNIPIDGGWKLW